MSCEYCSIEPATFSIAVATKQVEESGKGYGCFVVGDKEYFINAFGGAVWFKIKRCPYCGEDLEARHNEEKLQVDDSFNKTAQTFPDKDEGNITVFTENMYVNPEPVKLDSYKNGWVIVNADTGEVIDDGNGYGFKSRANAIKHYQYVSKN